MLVHPAVTFETKAQKNPRTDRHSPLHL